MIYTVTFNPSLDYVVKVTNLKLGKINRSQAEALFAGGKGINISIVLHRLGIKSIALGFISGFIGDEIKRKLDKIGCKSDFIKVENGLSRINVKIYSDEESAINGQGPIISRKYINMLFEKLDKLNSDDILILAGSIPNSISLGIYESILNRLAHKGIKVIIDAGKDLALSILKYEPFLVKPNRKELEFTFNTKIETQDEIIFHAKRLQESGAKNVLVSNADKGAVLLTEDGLICEAPAPSGTVINSVGSGDSMVAGFLAGYLQSKDYKEAFKMGLASGSASAFSEDLATGEEILTLLSKI